MTVSILFLIMGSVSVEREKERGEGRGERGGEGRGGERGGEGRGGHGRIGERTSWVIKGGGAFVFQ